MPTKIGSRYEIVSEITMKYSPYYSDEIKLYKGHDHLHNRPVLLKSFELPEKENARRLAITLWEREIRLTRKTMASKGGSILLQLLDAFIDKESGKLYVVTVRHGNALLEWIEGSNSLYFLENFDESNRRKLWKLFLTLLGGIEALHNSKLIHRNINPDTLFYSERSDFDELRISGITWSLYLHNLNFIPEKYKHKKTNFSIFKAPESFNVNERSSVKANPFAADIFSLGMVLCYIFFEDFPDIVPHNFSEWEEQFDQIIKYFRLSDHPLKVAEADFIIKCASKDPQVRYKTALEVSREIQKILLEFEEEQIVINEKLKVNWYSEPDSFFYRDIIRNTAISVDEIIENPNKWLSNDFTNSQIYTTGMADYTLVIISNKDHLFGLKPIYLKKDDKMNKDILELFVIRTRKRSTVLRAIQDKSPVNILKNGLQFTSEYWASDPLSKWRRILALADQKIKESHEDESKEMEFVESLEIMLEAEKQLDSENILQFKKLEIKRRPEDKIELATILVRSDLTTELNQKERREVFDKLINFRNKDGGLIELSVGNTPSSSWDHGREWKISKIRRRNLVVTIEREIKKKNKNLSEEGVLRPFEMNASLSLYRRKERVIDYIKENDLILSTLLEPQINTFYLGIDTENIEQPLANIINTIPMFLVQGPPGTGKTWIASSLVREILKNDPYARILVSSKDHEPLDYLVEAITEKNYSDVDPQPIFVRAMSSEREREYEASDLIVKYKSMNQIINKLKNAKEKLKTNDFLPKSLKKQWLDEIDTNVTNPSLKWMDELQKIANVFFATSTSSTVEWLVKNAAPFDYVIVEEAAKSYPTELLLPMILGHRWLLIGDQNQLPPYKYNQLAENMSELLDEEQIKKDEDDATFYDFRETSLTNIKLFEKLFGVYSKTPVLFSKERYFPCIQLNNQWRLPPVISDMISKIFYDTKFNTIKEASDKGDPFRFPDFLTENQIIWIDTPLGEENNEFMEKRTSEGSFINEGEIRIILDLVQKLKLSDQSKKLENIDLVLLTPYLAQKEQIIRYVISHPITSIKSQTLRRSCHTVDSFQGRQADIVIISLVRNNSQTNVRQALGFLTATERLNVMFSRVKKRMVIIGCSKHIKKFKNDEDSHSINLVLDFIRNNCKIISSTVLEGLK